MFYNIYETLSYNALFNFILGSRGCGKSYGAKKFCIDDFKKNKKQFVWVRRYDSELDDFTTGFFKDIKELYSDDILEYKSYTFYINKEVMGYAIPLSIASKKKSTSYAGVDKIIFDEFIIDKGNNHYLHKEVEVFLDLYETVMRMRDVRGAFFLANSVTFTNPYFLYFNINKPMTKKGISVNDDILIQYVNNKEYIETKNNTRFGKLIYGTEYGNYAINNEFLRDNMDFIIKSPPEKLEYNFTLRADSENFGVWISYKEGVYYVSRKIDPSCKLIYTTILENHKPNTLLLKGVTKTETFKSFINNFKLGNVLFDSIKTKNVVIETIKNTLLGVFN
jgi:hypothetical protein